MTFLRNRPWIWIIIAFVVLISSWTILLKIAGAKMPASVKIYQHPTENKSVTHDP